MTEIWKDVDGYDGLYQVSNFGRVKSFKHKTPRILKAKAHTGGYLRVELYGNGQADGRFIHRLVAQTFIPNPENKPTVNHIDGDKTNNRIENLEWATQHENNQHAVKCGLIKTGGDDYRANATNELVQRIRDEFIAYDAERGISALTKRYNLTIGTVFKIVHGKRYKTAGGQHHETKPQRPHKRLSAEIRAEIRRIHKPRHPEFGTVALAKRFGVDRSTILNVVKGR